jgi:pimeloyl-ACP methyl ester carboxylesterase
MGGYVALRAVERFPERVRALVLADTRSEADGNEAKVKRSASILTVKRDGVPAFAETFVKAVFAPQNMSAQPQAVEFIKSIIRSNTQLGIAGTLVALAARTDTTSSLAKIAVPTLIMVGEHDTLTPPAASEAMHKAIKDSKLIVIPGAGHLANIENEAAFNEALVAFLKQV